MGSPLDNVDWKGVIIVTQYELAIVFECGTSEFSEQPWHTTSAATKLKQAIVVVNIEHTKRKAPGSRKEFESLEW